MPELKSETIIDTTNLPSKSLTYLIDADGNYIYTHADIIQQLQELQQLAEDDADLIRAEYQKDMIRNVFNEHPVVIMLKDFKKLNGDGKKVFLALSILQAQLNHKLEEVEVLLKLQNS